MFVSDPHMYLTEVRFYERIRPGIVLETPRIYACAVDEAIYRFAVVIEDMTYRGARFPNALAGLTGEELAPLMSTLAALHAPNWDRIDLESSFDWLETATRGKSAVWWTSPQGRDVFDAEILAAPYKRDAVDLDRHPTELIYRAFARSQKAADREPRTVVHGDTHIANCYQRPDGVFGLLDWQLMRIATWANDVSYSIVTALDIEQRRRSEEDLLRHYLAELAAHGVDAPSWDDAWRQYRQQALYGLLSWTVTPTSMYSEGLLDALIRRAAAASDDLDTFAELDD
jgi:aminoglycoside phosphotransferase (APT) family kinase protein